MIGLRAPAKLTWYLEIIGRRSDGHHLIRSEMLTVALDDIVVIDETDDYVRVFNPFSTPVPQDQTNLVARALKLVGRTAGVTVEKSIPVGGGLGGGSADAAAILRWAGGVSSEAALSLGGDVPFCQLGGRALVEGVGEHLTPLDFAARTVTLITPDFGVSTADCYGAYDELVANGQRPEGRNHLEGAARLVEPRLARCLDWLRAELGHEVHLAGSGSTMFVEGIVGQPHLEMAGPDGVISFFRVSARPREA